MIVKCFNLDYFKITGLVSDGLVSTVLSKHDGERQKLNNAAKICLLKFIALLYLDLKNEDYCKITLL